MNKPRHPEADHILQRLRREGITELYHFTSIENLRGIREMNALCSKRVLEDASRWPVPEPGGDKLSHDLDRKNGNWNKISLNFTPYTPMAYWKKQSSHLCFFVIDVEIAGQQGVVFTNTNAASTGDQRRGEGLAGLELVNFKAMQLHPRPQDREGWKRPVQAEVLVPGGVDLRWVTEVAFVSEASLEEGRRVWGTQYVQYHLPLLGTEQLGEANSAQEAQYCPRFVVRPELFWDKPRSRRFGFPFLVKVALTERTIEKPFMPRILKKRFRRSTCERITLVAKLHALAGTRARVTWQPIGVVQTMEFEAPKNYWRWLSVPIRDLPNGRCSVEYRLGEVRWATLEFEVVP